MNDLNLLSPGTALSREVPVFATAVVLAGGRSSRMGFDKQLMTENDRPIMEQIIAALRQEFPDILVITSRPELYAGMHVRLQSDRFQGKGPLAGVHAALENARSRYIYLIACDMPVVNLRYIRYMKERLLASGADICACRVNDRLEPFNAFYSVALLSDVEKRLTTGNSSLFRFIGGNRTCELSQQEAAAFDKELRMFMNINTRTEYEKYLGIDDPSGDRKLVDKMEILRYIGGEYVPLRDLMVHETALEVEIPGLYRRTLYCSPAQLEELAVGHLFTQGFIRSPGDLSSLTVENGKAIAILDRRPAPAVVPPGATVFDPVALLANQERFYADSTLQKATAGTHRSALCDDGGTCLACVDISRHNTIDKLVGAALLQGISLRDKYIITSGRVPLDMVRKVSAIGIPMLVSRSTPTIASVEAARQAGITLLGFSRENRFNIYSAPHRLKGSPPEIK